MTSRCVQFILFIFLSFSAINCMAAGSSPSRSQGFNAYLAAGQNLILPSSVRFGWNSWEFGMLDKNFYGASKYFPIGEHTYSSFGIGVSSSINSNLGIQVATGFNYKFLWELGLRGEIMANAAFNGAAIAHGFLGISYGF